MITSLNVLVILRRFSSTFPGSSFTLSLNAVMRSPTLSIRCSPHAKDLFDEANAIILEPIPAMAAKNKCLAQSNKSHRGREATKKRVAQSMGID